VIELAVAMKARAAENELHSVNAMAAKNAIARGALLETNSMASTPTLSTAQWRRRSTDLTPRKPRLP
jgi:hypothetical protein